MINFTRLFIAEDSAGQVGFQGANSSRSGFIINVSGNDMLTVTSKFGCAPTTGEVNTALGRFLTEYEVKHGAIEKYKRTNRYRFAFYSGPTGCQDTYIETDTGDGFPSRKRICHMSMYGKVNEDIKCFIYDFLDMCVAEGFLTIKDGCYHYDASTDANAEMVAKCIKPRLVHEESGWVNPDSGELPKVVPLAIAREAGVEEKDEEVE